MKKIYTSNYARNGKNPNAYGTSYVRPRWYNGKMLPEIAPTKDLVTRYKNNEIDIEQYTREYIRTLRERGLTPEKALVLIPDRAILLCYEAPGDFCHRRVLAEWIYLHTGFIIPEL
ncbi:MAG: DUF488 domain-containing protein [Ignavibacteriaceae bacterium]|jgi:uncharacterized protein YeaO (DUF488 family)|nr:DUF488 domain-containing protein [Ignavibacteriaceae bacterium]